MVDITLVPLFALIAEPLSTIYKIYKLPSRISKLISLCKTIYVFIKDNQKTILMGIVSIFAFELLTTSYSCDAPRA